MARSLIFVIVVILTGSIAKAESMKRIRFTIGKNSAIAVLYNTQAAREFAAQLPLTLTFKDFASKEKIAYPPRKLSGKSKQNSEGDFAYYAPWGNIAVFYKEEASATADLLILGQFESGKQFFHVGGSFEVKIEALE
ncbi:cyclophilin-like fold protein [Bdellovibrio bacteriovorus]|uniref:cyclophilin-like fold protein n=1 Tax=Bdellovibrio bacteriovorus TaxID=959 RepID=UPI000682B8D2|nr:cyclophilin-like fold protein [Bdellovibrio bacteriovorus]